jgi:N,N'-diacetyllegionaminate synthase
MSRASRLATYQREAGERDPVEMLRRLELPIGVLGECAAEARRVGVHAIVSVFSVELVTTAERVDWDAYKTASPDIINRPLLDALAATGRPLIVSTGASTMDEVRRAAGWLEEARGRLALLQCVSSYPTRQEDAELGGVPALIEAFPHLPVGYSDHTQGESTGLDAALLGACILEKHFTDDTGRAGPDHRASLDPGAFAVYCLNVRGGTGLKEFPAEHVPAGLREALRLATTPPPGITAAKRVLAIEEDVRRVSRQSLVTSRAMPAGVVIRREDLTIKRPGTGVPPFELAGVLGRRLAREVEADTPLRWEDLAP